MEKGVLVLEERKEGGLLFCRVEFLKSFFLTPTTTKIEKIRNSDKIALAGNSGIFDWPMPVSMPSSE